MCGGGCLSLSRVWLFATLSSIAPAGSFIRGILQGGILDWVAIPFSMGSPRPRNRTQSIGCTPIQNRKFWKKQTKEWGSILGRSVHQSQKKRWSSGWLHTSNVGSSGLIPGPGTKIPPSQSVWSKPNRKGGSTLQWSHTERGWDQVWGLSQRGWYDVSFRL